MPVHAGRTVRKSKVPRLSIVYPAGLAPVPAGEPGGAALAFAGAVRERSRRRMLAMFAAGALAGVLLTLAYHGFVYAVCTDVLQDIHFLIREQDASGAGASLDRHTSYSSGNQRANVLQLIRLRRELRQEAQKHLEDRAAANGSGSNQAPRATGAETAPPEPR